MSIRCDVEWASLLKLREIVYRSAKRLKQSLNRRHAGLEKPGGRRKSPPCSSGSADRQRGGKPMLPLNGQRRESSAEYGRGHSSSFGFRKEFDQFQVVRFIDFLRRPAPWADKHMTDEVVARNNLSVATAARKVEIYSFDL